MNTRGVWVLAVLAAVLVAGATACGDDSNSYKTPTTTTRPTPPQTIPAGATKIVPDATARPAINALKCTSTAKAAGKPGTGPGSVWLAQSIDCFHDNRFVARVDSYRHTATPPEFTVAMTARYGTRTKSDPKAASSPCGTDSPGVVAGNYWVIVTPGEDGALGAAKAAGGKVIAPLNGAGPIKDYPPLHCTP